jgi:catechol 2,3-dioxygenase-like lactoylglutathione lyase family enzyme
MITGLDLLFLEVNKLEESLEFYREVLGFEVESHEQMRIRRWLLFDRVRCASRSCNNSRRCCKRGRGVHFVLGVTDVDEFYRSLKKRHVNVAEPRDEGWGGRFVSLQDPDGYRYFFVSWTEENHRNRPGDST